MKAHICDNMTKSVAKTKLANLNLRRELKTSVNPIGQITVFEYHTYCNCIKDICFSSFANGEMKFLLWPAVLKLKGGAPLVARSFSCFVPLLFCSFLSMRTPFL